MRVNLFPTPMFFILKMISKRLRAMAPTRVLYCGTNPEKTTSHPGLVTSLHSRQWHTRKHSTAH